MWHKTRKLVLQTTLSKAYHLDSLGSSAQFARELPEYLPVTVWFTVRIPIWLPFQAHLESPWNFLSFETSKGVFSYVNEVTFGLHLKETGCLGNRPRVRSWTFSPTPWCLDSIQSPKANVNRSYLYVGLPVKTPKGGGSENFRVGEQEESRQTPQTPSACLAQDTSCAGSLSPEGIQDGEKQVAL